MECCYSSLHGDMNPLSWGMMLCKVLNLDLAGNGSAVAGIDQPGMLTNLTQLTQFSAAGLGMRAVPPGQFAGLSQLTHLDLSGNPITDLPIERVAGLESLEVWSAV